MDSGGSVGILIVNQVTVSGSGGILDITNGGTLDLDFLRLSSTSSDTGIKLDNVSGRIDVTPASGTDTSITGATTGIDVRNSTGGFDTYLQDTEITAETGINLIDNIGGIFHFRT